MTDSEEEQYQAKVAHTFEANTGDELNITDGEVVTVLKEDKPWAHVRNMDGEDGYVPLDYIKRIREPTNAPPPPPRPKKPPTQRTYRMDDNIPPTPNTPAPGPVRAARGRGRSMDSSPAWNIFAASLEWWACLTLFIAGVFSLMWGSSQVPEDRLNETLGTFSCIAAAILLVYFSMFREIGAEKAAILRAFVLLLTSVLSWFSWPLGVLGGGPLVFAAFANFMVWIRRSALLGDAKVRNDQWLTLSFDCSDVFKTSRGALAFLFLHVCANAGYYILGMWIGQQRIDLELDENRFILGTAHKHAEGWGVIISFNLVWLFLFSLYGLHDYMKEWAQLRIDEEGCCIKNLNRGIIWLTLDKRQLFLHKVFATTILIASVGHMFESYSAWETSGSGRDYFEVFGQETFATGVAVVWCEIVIFAAVSPQLVERHRELFVLAHSCWGLLVLLLVVHGKRFLGKNFWKFIIGPMVLYLMDRLFRSGGNVAVRMRDDMELA